MRIRTVITAILAAILCLIALRFLYYRIELSIFVPGWSDATPFSNLPGWVSTVIFSYCAITLFAFGWVSARWNWAPNWRRSLQAGLQTGLLAGCLIYDFVGAFWFSLKGQADVLSHFYIPVTEAEGTRIVADAMIRTGVSLYGYFLLTVAICALVGGLGGVASALTDKGDFWGTHPRNPESWLFHSTAYLLTTTGYINLVVAMAVFNLLRPKILNTANIITSQYGLPFNVEIPSYLSLVFTNLTIYMFAFLPAGITWGWIIRTWVIRKRTSFLPIAWLIFSTVGLLLLTWFLMPSILSNPVDLACILIASFLGTGIGVIWQEQAEGFPYHLSDWFAYALTYGILGGTQILMGAVAYSISTSLIVTVNIAHLVRQGLVEQEPIEQVMRLFKVLHSFAGVAIIASIVISLIAISPVAFLRTLLGLKDSSAES